MGTLSPLPQPTWRLDALHTCQLAKCLASRPLRVCLQSLAALPAPPARPGGPGEGTQRHKACDAEREEKENIGREVGTDRGEPAWQIMFEDIRQFEALHPHFMQLQAAGSCTVIDGSMHPENRTVTNGGGPTAGYRYYEKCPFAIKTCPANYYSITPSMECGVMGAIVPKLEGPESTPKLLADNPSHPLNNGVPMFQPFTVTAP